MLPPLITLEEHFFSTAFLTSPAAAAYSEQLTHIPNLLQNLTSLSDLRLTSMSTNNIRLQIVSHGPAGSMPPPLCTAANNELHAAILAHPNRLRGFAVLPIEDPVAAAEELQRCVKQLGFVGALIDNHTPTGGFYDGSEYDCLWAMAEALGVPIYLHPTWPSTSLASQLYSGNFSAAAAASLGASGFGWHSAVGLHVLRLFAAGLFDRFPKVKVVIGHMGEMLPFMLERIVQLSTRWGKRERAFREVWDANVWVTTSGVWSVDPMATILRNTRIERVLFSVDWPFARNEDGVRFMRDLEESGLVDREGLEMIAWRNAEALLGVRMEEDVEG